MSTQNAYIKKLETELKKIDKQIAALRKKKNQIDKRLQGRYKSTMATLSEKKATAKTKLKEAKAAWRAISKGMEASWKSLRSSVDKARKEFK
jgi:uncharacterized protein YecT (DUF1311 family)